MRDGTPTSPESVEIERKFLLAERPAWLQNHPSVHIRQGYLAIVPGEVEVRVRVADDRPVLTVKRGRARSAARRRSG